MLQTCIFFYFFLLFFILVSFLKINRLQKFFFYSEVIWITLFILLLNLEIFFNTINLYNNCFFILVFTAIEALIIASLLLLESKKNF